MAVSNVDIANAIRSMSSLDYQARIPKATQDNVKNVLETVMDYKTTKEEFYDVLLNKIIKQKIMSKLWENPYKFFKKEPLPIGKTIEGIFVDIIKGKSFNDKFGDGTSEASSLLAKENPENIKVEYYSENYKHKYKVSISDTQIKSAFLDTNGIQSLCNAQIQAALTSAEYDEFLLVKGLLNHTKIKEKVLSGYRAETNENVKSKMLTKAIKTYMGYFKFLRKDFNTQGVYTHSSASDIVIFVTPETSAMLDVELLASAFNMQKADIEGKLVMIDGFEKLNADGNTVEVDDDTLAIMCDMELIQMRDSLNQSESFRNPDTLTTNMFIHRWGSAQATGFVNAIKIKQEAQA